jgi:hypothetical protein
VKVGASVLRFPIMDEWLGLCVVAGGFLAARLGGLPRRGPAPDRLRTLVFLLLMLHLLSASLLGAAFWNLKALRFTLLFAVVLGFFLLVRRYDFPRPSPVGVGRLVAASGIGYFVLYLLHGFIFESTVWVTNMEGLGVAGAAYAVYPAVVVLPAAVVLQRGGRSDKLLGWMAFALAIAVAAVGDARGVIVAVLGTVLVSPFALGGRRSTRLLIGATVAAAMVGTVAFEQPAWFVGMVDHTLSSGEVEGGYQDVYYYGSNERVAKGDAERTLLVQASLLTWLEGHPVVSILGGGMYSYFPLAGDRLDSLRSERGVPAVVPNFASSIDGVSEDRPRPPALGASIVEYGLLGVALFVVAIGAVLGAALLRKSAAAGRLEPRLGPHLLIILPILLTVAWTYFGEIQDMLLAYLLIMPLGLTDGWLGLRHAGRAAEAVEGRPEGSPSRLPPFPEVGA